MSMWVLLVSNNICFNETQAALASINNVFFFYFDSKQFEMENKISRNNNIIYY